jgi:hypothetical protein
MSDILTRQQVQKAAIVLQRVALLQERVDYVQDDVYLNSFRISSLKNQILCCSFAVVTEVSAIEVFANNYFYISNCISRKSSDLSSAQSSELDRDPHSVLSSGCR